MPAAARPQAIFVGIDEAGYGPNLGPLTLGAVAALAPIDWELADWWDRLAPAIGRHDAAATLAIDDSKKILARRAGKKRLRDGVHAACQLSGFQPADFLSVYQYLTGAETGPVGEHWFSPEAADDDATAAVDVGPVGEVLERNGVTLLAPMARAIFPAAFNRELAALGNKAKVELEGIAGILDVMLRRPEFAQHPIHITIDRLGGRRYYRAFVERIAGDAFPRTLEESPRFSQYVFVNGDREVTIGFRVAADSGNLLVAWGSMIAKYLRECCMERFNRFWTTRVTDLKPTAGYPADARRFFDAIYPRLTEIGIDATSVWRNA